MATKKPMSADHKAALAEGRKLSRAVRGYLDALESHRPKRGRQRTVESITKQLAQIEEKIADADPLKRVQLIQDRLDLNQELERKAEKVDLSGLEADFVGAAKDYSATKGISYKAWREVGVPADVLKRAGIGRGD